MIWDEERAVFRGRGMYHVLEIQLYAGFLRYIWIWTKGIGFG